MELVFGEAMDAALAELSNCLREVQLMWELLVHAAAATPGRGAGAQHGDMKRTHRVLQAGARSVLRQVSPDPARMVRDPLDAVRLVTGHCRTCGWIEAPQPCLGVCIFRAVEMVPAAAYDEVRRRSEHAAQLATNQRAVIRQLAWVTPRAGEWERTGLALQSLAREALARARP